MNILDTIKEKVKGKFPNQTLYPDKTTDLLAYCDKNIPLMLEAYELDLSEGKTRHTNMAISHHYYGNRRQTKNIKLETELWIQETLVELLTETKNLVEKQHLDNCFKLWKDVLQGESYESNQSFLENLTMNRASYSEFSNESIDNVKLQKILEAANGITPSLSNNFHYRVDVLPQETRDAMYPYMHSFFPDATEKTKKEFEENPTQYTEKEWREKGICFNTQFNAPLILAYSIPARVTGDRKRWYPNEFETSRDATLVAVGLNMWNTICTVEEMGLNSCCLKAYNPKALDMIEIKTSEEMPDDWHWQPYVFLCIGKGIRQKGDHRKYKPRGIVNTLEFEVA
jgi:predicted oxidoreductase (fatty acid repression mutant protein)